MRNEAQSTVLVKSVAPGSMRSLLVVAPSKELVLFGILTYKIHLSPGRQRR